MSTTPVDADAEIDRLQELHRYGILDTPPEESFDELTRLAAEVCGTPIALISLSDRCRQWFKSRVGFASTEVSRDRAFCEEVIHGHGLLIIEDAQSDPRYSDHPLVVGPAGIRFYAGSVLKSSRGLALGALCVLDRSPRQLTSGQRQTLELLARQVAQQLELRRVNRELAASEARYDAILSEVGDALFCVDEGGVLTYASAAWATLVGTIPDTAVGTPVGDHFQGANRTDIAQLVEQAIAGRPGAIEVKHLSADGNALWLQIVAAPAKKAGNGGAVMGRVSDISRMKRAEYQHLIDTERLRRQTVLFERTQVVAHIGGWDFDVDSSELWWSPETYRIHGLLPENYHPSIETAIGFYARSSRATIRSAVETALKDGTSYDLELELLVADGNRRWVRSQGFRESRNGRPYRLYGTFQDITERRSLEQAVLTAAQEEREQIGYELHDGISQELTGTALLLRSLCERVRGSDAALAADLNYATGLVNDSLEACRALAHHVAPASKTHGGLKNALRRLSARIEKASGLTVCLVLQVSPDAALDTLVSDSLYLIAQEALTNAMKHSEAKNIQLSLVAQDSRIRLKVTDDGRGRSTIDTTAGLGVRLMHYRARLIDSQLTISRNPDGGTVVECSLDRVSDQAATDSPHRAIRYSRRK